jgi:hypothetical protein
MWRRRITGHAPAATRVAIAFEYYNRTWASIFNRSMCLNGEKRLMVVSQVEGSKHHVKEALFKFKGAATTRFFFFGINRLGVFEGGIIYN